MTCINIIIQARTSSSRLPNKVLKPILARPMLAHQIDRLKQVKNINKLIVATSDNESDDLLVAMCKDEKVDCFRGNLTNVLERFYQASLLYPSEHIVRITGDCPVICPDIIEKVIQLHLAKGADYTSNCLPPTLPDGLDVEIFTVKCLHKTFSEAKKPSELEHVTPYMTDINNAFKRENYYYPTDHSKFRWTVDEPEDFILIEKFYQLLYPKKPNFGLVDMLNLQKQKPALTSINQHIKRNEGMLTTKQIDQENGYE